MEQLVYLVVLGTAIWAGIDASQLGARRGVLGGGFLDMGPVAWFFAVWLLWIIAFPCYLVARPRLVAVRDASAYRQVPAAPYGYGVPVGHQAFSSPPPAQPAWGQPAAASAAQWGPPAPSSATAASTVNQLARLEALRDRGSLTPAEFDTLKQQVLDAGTA